eukprot:1195663-Prorocentrum_minimum.AAC.1
MCPLETVDQPPSPRCIHNEDGSQLGGGWATAARVAPPNGEPPSGEEEQTGGEVAALRSQVELCQVTAELEATRAMVAIQEEEIRRAAERFGAPAAAELVARWRGQVRECLSRGVLVLGIPDQCLRLDALVLGNYYVTLRLLGPLTG